MSSEGGLFLCMIGMILCIVMLKRIDLVFRSRIQALDIAQHFAVLNEKVIPFQEFIKVLDSYPSFSGMMLLISCWNFDQFYPDLAVRIRKVLVTHGVLEEECHHVRSSS